MGKASGKGNGAGVRPWATAEAVASMAARCASLRVKRIGARVFLTSPEGFDAMPTGAVYLVDPADLIGASKGANIVREGGRIVSATLRVNPASTGEAARWFLSEPTTGADGATLTGGAAPGTGAPRGTFAVAVRQGTGKATGGAPVRKGIAGEYRGDRVYASEAAALRAVPCDAWAVLVAHRGEGEGEG